jgi:hypothetical protein
LSNWGIERHKMLAAEGKAAEFFNYSIIELPNYSITWGLEPRKEFGPWQFVGTN